MASDVWAKLSGKVPEVTSASDDLPSFNGLPRFADDEEEEDEGKGRRASKERGGGMAEPGKYEWEGEKLSWEVGAGVRPDELPEYARDFRISQEADGEEGEVC